MGTDRRRGYVSREWGRARQAAVRHQEHGLGAPCQPRDMGL